MTDHTPTDRELDLLNVLWEKGEATVRQVHDALRQDLPIVQNTVQALLRTMAEKGLVEFRTEGRSFVYRAAVPPEATRQRLLDGVLQRAYDGAIDRLVAGALSLRRPTPEELGRVRAMLEEFDAASVDDQASGIDGREG